MKKISKEPLYNLSLSQYIVTDVEDVNCMAFEIFPTNIQIPAGISDNIADLSSLFGWNDNELEYVRNNIVFTNLPYTSEVQANDECFLEFYSHSTYENSDISVDWGDGTIEALSSNYSNPYGIGVVANISHVYQSYKPTVVKIYGSSYYMLRNCSNYDSSKKSIIRRIFSPDLPTAPQLQNVASICKKSNHLLKAEIPLEVSKQIKKFCNAFQECENLKEAEIDFMTDQIEVHDMFLSCVSLSSIDFQLPSGVELDNGYTRMFRECGELNADVLDILPYNGFAMQQVNLMEAFRNCRKLYCSDYEKLARLLWENNLLHKTNDAGLTYCFLGCSSMDLTKIPKFLGGTMDYFPMNIDELIEENRKLNELVNQLYDGNIFQMKNGKREYVPSYELTSNTLEIEENKLSDIQYVVKTSHTVKTVPENMFFKKSINGFSSAGVESVLSNAFRECYYLTSVNLPNMISVGNSAFQNCTNISSIELNSCTTFKNGCFNGCSKLTEISCRNLTSIADYPFVGANKLSAIYVDNAVLKSSSNGRGVDNSIIVNADGKTLQLVLPTVTELSDDGISSFGSYWPFKLSKMTSISVENLDYVPWGGFAQMQNIEYIYAPNMNSLISKNAFYNMKACVLDMRNRKEELISRAPRLQNIDTFNGINGILSVYVDQQFYNTLTSDTIWKQAIDDNKIEIYQF